MFRLDLPILVSLMFLLSSRSHATLAMSSTRRHRRNLIQSLVTVGSLLPLLKLCGEMTLRFEFMFRRYCFFALSLLNMQSLYFVPLYQVLSDAAEGRGKASEQEDQSKSVRRSKSN